MSILDMSKDSRSFLHGTLDLAILKTLDTLGPLHGYGIARRLEQAAGGARLSQGAVYPALMRLEQEGFIATKWGVSETGRRVKFYSLTKAGNRQLHAEIVSWQQSVGMMTRLLKDKA